jgi:CCR4-NOT transcription complex subunit 10
LDTLIAIQAETKSSKISLSANSELKGDTSSTGVAEPGECNVLKYNLAAILFQQREYERSALVLQTMMAHIDSLDEGLAIKTCFLLLDLYLVLRAAGKAGQVLEYVAKLANSQDDAKHHDSSSSSNHHTPVTPKIPAVELKFLVHLYRTRVLLLANNVKMAKKEIKAAMQVYQREMKEAQARQQRSNGKKKKSSDSNDKSTGTPSLDPCHSTSALFLKAQIEYVLFALHAVCCFLP